MSTLKNDLNDLIYKIHKVKSTRRDAADILMILHVGKIIKLDEKINLIVLTNDHFGHSLIDCLKELNSDSLNSYISLNSLSELSDYLLNINDNDMAHWIEIELFY